MTPGKWSKKGIIMNKEIEALVREDTAKEVLYRLLKKLQRTSMKR